MKILVLVKRTWPESIGGVEKHLCMVSKILEKNRGYEIKYLTETEVGTDKWEIWRNVWKYKKLFDWADVIHIHDVFFWVFFLRLFYLKKKFFVTFHGWEGIYPVPWKNILIRKISELMANGNICVGKFIQKYYFTKPNFIIYGASDKHPARNAFSIPASNASRSDAGWADAGGKNEKILRKDAVFVGKEGKDLEFYKKLAKKMKVKLDVFTNDPNASQYFYKYKYAFVSGYLSILEAMSQDTQVYAYYDNPLKYDYLNMTPFNIPGYPVPTWDQIADIYEKLWQK